MEAPPLSSREARRFKRLLVASSGLVERHAMARAAAAARTPAPRRMLDRLLHTYETRRPGLATTTAQAEAIYLPTAEPGLGARGVVIGKELLSGTAFIYDAFELYGAMLTGPNMLVLGDLGSGKSAMVKSLVLRQLRFGRQAAVIDSKNQGGVGEYTKIARALGVTPIRLVPGARRDPLAVTLNPLDPAISASHQLSLLRTIGEVALHRELSPREGNALLHAHARVMQAAGGEGRQATLPEVVEALFNPTEEAARASEASPETLREEGRDLALELNRLVEGDLKGMFDRPTTASIDLGAPLILFDLSAVDPYSEALPILMSLVGVWLESVWIRPDGRNRLFVVDEGWHVIGNLYTARLFRRLWKFARGLGVQNIAIVHHLSDLTATGDEELKGAINSLLEEAHTKVIYRQSSKETRRVADALGLSQAAMEEIPDLRRGCAVWAVGQRVRVVQHVLSSWERSVVTTDEAMTGATQ